MDTISDDMLNHIAHFLLPVEVRRLMSSSKIIRHAIQEGVCNPFRKVHYNATHLNRMCIDTRQHIKYVVDVSVTWQNMHVYYPRLTHITLAEDFSKPLNLKYCNTLKSITFKNAFNLKLTPNDLPQNLDSLIFSSHGYGISLYNHPFERGVLPKRLRRLEFGYSFRYPLPQGVLPDSLEILTFGVKHDLPLADTHFPSGLIELSLGDNFNRAIKRGELPESLCKLSLGRRYNTTIDACDLPPRITHLIMRPGGIFNCPIRELPQCVVHLDLGDSYTHPIPMANRLEVLKFGIDGLFNRDLNIYANMNKLHTSEMFNRQLTTLAYTKLTELYLGNEYNLPLSPGILPHMLQVLQFGEMFNHPLVQHALPPRLLKLVFHKYSLFNYPIDQNVLPISLEELTFGYKFNSNIYYLPDSLNTIRFGRSFNQGVPNVPVNIKTIFISVTPKLLSIQKDHPGSLVDISRKRTRVGAYVDS